MKVAIVPGHVKPTYDSGAHDPIDEGQNDHLESRERILTPLYMLDTMNALWSLGHEAYTVVGFVPKTVRHINQMGFDAAISIHFNASAQSSNGDWPRGAEIWVPEGSHRSSLLADYILRGVVRYPSEKIVDRGVRKATPGTRARSFLDGLTVPGVLCELGFITNPEEERRIHSPGFRAYCAGSIALGVQRWFESL